MTKQKWQGEKSAGTHTTLIETAFPLVRKAENLSQVKKISLGFIKMTPGTKGKRGLRFTSITGGLKITVRDHTSLQEIWVYTDSPQEVQEQLKQVRL